MKKEFLVLIITSLIFSIATAQNQNTDWARMKVKGKVKTMREISYSVTDKPGDTKKQNGKRTDSLIYNFSNNGNLTEERTYNQDGSLKEKTTYLYDKNGNKTEENLFNPDGSLKEKYTYKYEHYKDGK